MAESVEWEIVHVVAEGVFDFATDERNSENDVGGEDGGGDCDPAERLVKLEGQEKDVNPGDLTNCNGVGERKGRVEDTLSSSHDVVHRKNSIQRVGLADGCGESGVVEDDVHIGTDMSQDLERQISERLGRALDVLSRIRLSHGKSEERSCFLEDVGLLVQIR